MQSSVSPLRMMELTGVRPPVDLLTLLLPYPPKAGRFEKHEPTMLAVPRATSSRLGLSWMPAKPSLPRLLAATDDSKKPSRAMRNDVLMASRMYVTLEGWKGQRNVNRRPLAASTLPSTATPALSHSYQYARKAEKTTTRNRSGM